MSVGIDDRSAAWIGDRSLEEPGRRGAGRRSFGWRLRFRDARGPAQIQADRQDDDPGEIFSVHLSLPDRERRATRVSHSRLAGPSQSALAAGLLIETEHIAGRV